MIFTMENLQQKATQSMAPRRSQSQKKINVKREEKKQQDIIGQSFAQKAHKRRSLSLGPDDRLIVDKMHNDMLPIQNSISKGQSRAKDEEEFQIHTSGYKRPNRKPLSIGASSQGSGIGQRFKARPMPKFTTESPRATVLLAEKQLTAALPFDFETEKRSRTRLETKPKKPVLIDDSGSAKENYI